MKIELLFVVLVEKVVLLLRGAFLGVGAQAPSLELLLKFGLSAQVAVFQLVFSDERPLFHLESSLFKVVSQFFGMGGVIEICS